MCFLHFLIITGTCKAQNKGSGVQPFHKRNPFHSASISLEAILRMLKRRFSMSRFVIRIGGVQIG